MENNPVPQSSSDPLARQYERSRQAWKRLWLALAGVTPRALARGILLLGGLFGLGWLALASWPAMLPFVVGGVIAYIVSPLVNLLDKLMPRMLAALLGVLLVLGGIGALLWAVVPPLVSQTVALVQRIPPDTTLKDLSEQLIVRLQFLPPSVKTPVATAISDTTTRLQDTLRSMIALLFTSTVILRVVSAVGFILGLVVLPTWLLTVLKDQPRAQRSLYRLLPDTLRDDAWAVLRIFDRAFGAFFRGQVLVALAVGLTTYLGLRFLTRLGAPDSPYLVTFAVLAGVFQLIPEIGPLLNILITVLVAYRISETLALYVLALYIGIQYLVAKLVKDRIEERIVDLTPALLVLIIVALSQLGFFWLFFAAPVTGVARDLFRYVYGRLGEPPRPAGLLPGEPLPAQALASAVAGQPASPPGRRVPLVYQRRQNRAER
ncbi:MAG: AI-2E family transporter [Chloroflexota bacterium]